jgi:hypothetical protein
MFFNEDIKRAKVDAVADMMIKINPDIKEDIQIFREGWIEKTKLSGYVFLCVDNIDLVS